MSGSRDGDRDRLWRQELRAWDAGLGATLDETPRAALRRRVLEAAEEGAAPSPGNAGWWATAAAAVLLVTVAALLWLMRSPPPDRHLIELAATPPAGVGTGGDDLVAGLDGVVAPEAPPRARSEPESPTPVPTPAAETQRRVRRLALRAPSGRQIHWVLDSEFALGGRE